MQIGRTADMFLNNSSSEFEWFYSISLNLST